ARVVPERRAGWRPKARRMRHRSGFENTEPYGSVYTQIDRMQEQTECDHGSTEFSQRFAHHRFDLVTFGIEHERAIKPGRIVRPRSRRARIAAASRQCGVVKRMHLAA